jgi:hypothetical protein
MEVVFMRSFPRLVRMLTLVLLVVAALDWSPSASFACAGDCDGDEDVDVAELVLGLNVALGRTALDECSSFDESGDGGVSIDEVVQAVAASGSRRCKC